MDHNETKSALVKNVSLKVDTYRKSFALRVAIKNQIDKLSELVACGTLSEEVTEMFQRDLDVLRPMYDELQEWT